MKYASLGLLSFQRPEFLMRTLNSLFNTEAGYRYELIVNDDGSDNEVKDYLFALLKNKKISFLILNGGKNMGVGRSIQNCLKLSSGDYLFKVDSDLEFRDGWLKKAIEILEDKKVGCVSLFNYRHYNPNDERFNILEERENYYVVDDFVSSIYGFRRELWDKYGKHLGTDGWHQFIKSKGYDLAITKQDYVENFGFGEDKSIYVKGGKPIKVSNSPLIF